MNRRAQSNDVLNVVGIIVLIFLILGIIAIASSVYVIDAGERGVLLTLGKPDSDFKGPGLHFKTPFIQTIKKFDIKTNKYEAEAAAASKDLQNVKTKMAVNFRIQESSVVDLYSTVGLDYVNRIIQPMEQEVVKAITAKFTAEELITKREEVREDIKLLLIDRLGPRGIIVEEVSITNFDFSESFNVAIESKVTAEQNALAAKNKLEQIKFEAEQRIAEAKGKAEAITIESIALKQNKDIIELRAIEKWDGKMPLVTGNGATPFIDINSLTASPTN